MGGGMGDHPWSWIRSDALGESLHLEQVSGFCCGFKATQSAHRPRTSQFNIGRTSNRREPDFEIADRAGCKAGRA